MLPTISAATPLKVYIAPLLIVFCLTSVEARTLKNVVIGTNFSSIVEDLSATSTPSLQPNFGSLTPFGSVKQSISLPVQEQGLQIWFGVLGKSVIVIHRQKDLQYQGILNQVDQNIFTLEVGSQLIHLNINDFYLSHAKEEPSPTKALDQVSYLTQQLSWTPQRRLIIDKDTITLHQNAYIANLSKHDLLLQEALLQLQPTTQQVQSTGNLTLLAERNNTLSTQYNNSEITIPLVEDLTLSSYSHTLLPLNTQTVKIDSHIQKSMVRTHINFLDTVDLNFEQKLDAQLKSDALPGIYKTFWRRDSYLIPSGEIQLEHVRQGHNISVIPNKSQDVIGKLTLLDSSQQQQTKQQTWQIELENLSDDSQNIEITHQLGAIIESFNILPDSINQQKKSLKNNQVSANTHKIKAVLIGKEKSIIKYRVVILAQR